MPVSRRFQFALSTVLAAAALACSAKTPSSGHPAGAAGASGSSGAGVGGGGVGGGGVGGGGAGAGGTGGGGTGGSGGASGAGGAPATGVAGGTVGDASADGAGGASVDGASGVPDAVLGEAGGSVGTGCKGATVCYDFEECATPKGWTVPPSGGNQGPGTTLVDNVMPHSGMCALHMKDFSGDSPQHAYLANLPAAFGPVLWGRAWIFTTSAPSMHGALIKARYAVAGSNNLDWYEVGYEFKNYNGHWHNPLPPSGLPEWILRSTRPIDVGRWACVEWLWDADNGGMAEAADPRIWVDGQELMFGPGIQYDGTGTKPQRPTTPRGTNFVSIEVGLTMYHPVDEKMNVFFDELAFGRQRVGCNP